ncbi:MAG: tetratricopeptide repeat protein [Alphaproteobacteria bacterium]|nr:tetratricopeptide repeat protein [Alphaproteobacteria bacterium]
MTAAAGTRSIEAVKSALDAENKDAAVDHAYAMAEATPPDADGLLAVSDWLTKRKRFGDAAALLEPHLAKFDADPRFHWAIGLAYSSTYQHGRAERHLRVVADHNIALGPAQYLMGRNLFKSRRNEESLPYLNRAVALMPTHVDAHFLLALSQAATEDYESAVQTMRVAAKLDPANHVVQQHLVEIEQAAKAPPPRRVFARWPKAAKDFEDLDKIIREYVCESFDTRGIALSRGSRVFTQGSCFAGNIARSLKRHDLKVTYAPCGEEQNNTYANCVVLDWIKNGAHDEKTAIVEENLGFGNRDELRAAISSAEIFIYTMGVAATHFDRETGEFVMSRNTNTSKAALFKRAVFMTTTVKENVDNLKMIVSAVREFSPRAAIVLTVSPVPMTMTTEMNSAVVSDCLSKSTLRVAIEEILRLDLPRVVYWPSFEIIRWLGGHVGPVYGSDDGSSHHVNLSMINRAVDSFLMTFGDADFRQIVANKVSPAG